MPASVWRLAVIASLLLLTLYLLYPLIFPARYGLFIKGEEVTLIYRMMIREYRLASNASPPPSNVLYVKVVIDADEWDVERVMYSYGYGWMDIENIGYVVDDPISPLRPIVERRRPLSPQAADLNDGIINIIDTFNCESPPGRYLVYTVGVETYVRNETHENGTLKAGYYVLYPDENGIIWEIFSSNEVYSGIPIYISPPLFSNLWAVMGFKKLLHDDGLRLICVDGVAIENV